MFISLPDLFIILEKYKYLVIFPITIFEGPIIIILSGFLAYLGFLNVFIIFPMLVLGDLIGDSMYYAIGRYAGKFNWIRKIGLFLGYKEANNDKLKTHFKKHTVKTLLIGKISHGIGAIIQVTAGIAEVKFWKYFLVEMIGTIPKTLLLFLIGFYLGNSYLKIDSYLDGISYVFITLAIIFFIYLMLNKYSTRDLK